MTKRMLIDATHAEETRVVVLDGNRLEDFDVETSTKKQLKGNIYLAKVVRVEPSLQAAFVEYGGNRHGFLAFGEIHPDYYQIPVADRQRLLEMQAEEAREEEEAEDRAAAAAEAKAGVSFSDRGSSVDPAAIPTEAEQQELASHTAGSHSEDEGPAGDGAGSGDSQNAEPPREPESPSFDPESREQSSSAQPAAIEHEVITGPPLDADDEVPAHLESGTKAADREEPQEQRHAETPSEAEAAVELSSPATIGEAEIASSRATEIETLPETEDAEPHNEPAVEQLPPPEIVGGEGDSSDEPRDRRIPPRFLRHYKIQEVIKRRQILLVQVVKEERGTKGAALTTYMSLAGRYCVLMPNSPRGGGISRKITSAADRRRLKEITAELDIPKGMGLIVRTAGANRPKPEIKRDCEYLMRLWDDIRDHTMQSVAPALIYEEASLIKRSIRDVYSRDLDEIVVDGEEGWKSARDFMRMLMPSHAKKVQMWRDGGHSLFAKHQVDSQLDAMMSPTVQLRSGGYLVINQAEALVAIDVNSGRSTRERGIEETALRTNLEAADEVARQLRLRDLAGLIVIDFIDMESKRNNALVERRLKEALKNDRARIQVGHISHFGLLEMSRQRLRPSLAETSFIPCPHCGGNGLVRSTESAAIHVLRQIEEEGAKRRSAEVVVYAATSVALYILNHKRERLGEIETRHGLHVSFATDDKLVPPEIRIDRVRAAIPSELPPVVMQEMLPPPAVVEDEPAAEETPEEEFVAADEPDETVEQAAATGEETPEEAERRRRRRRRRRRSGGRREDGTPNAELAESAESEERPEGPLTDQAVAESSETPWPLEGVPERVDDGVSPPDNADEAAPARGRNRRGGRRRRREGADEAILPLAEPGAEQPDVPAYVGPTPADPFGGRNFDIFDLMDPENQQPLHPTGATGSAQPLLTEATPVEAPPEPETLAILATEAPVTEAPANAPANEVENEEHREAAPPVPEEPRPVPAEPITQDDREEPVGEHAPAASEGDAAGAEPEVASAEPVEEAAPQPANDVAPEPLIKPILVGAEGEPAAEKRRGWWRR